MNFDIYATKKNIHRNVEQFNRWQTDPYARTCSGIIKSVNTTKYTADIYIPSSSTKIYNVLIGNNILGGDDGKNFLSLPSVGQRCIVLLSSVHPSVMIAIFNDSGNEVSRINPGECFWGNDQSYIKQDINNNISIRSNSVIEIGDDTYISSENMIEKFLSTFSQEVVKLNLDLINEDTSCSRSDEFYIENRKTLLSKNTKVMSDLHNILEEFEKQSSNIETEDVNQYKSILNAYGAVIDKKIDSLADFKAYIDIGDTVNNKANNSNISIGFKDKQSNKKSLIFGKDGTITVNCSDFVINKEV